MAVDLYTPRTMDAMLRQMKAPRSFLLDRLFTGERTFSSESVDIDIATGARRMAPYVGNRSAGKAVDAIGFKTMTHTPPLVSLTAEITEDHLRRRLPGEHIYEGRSPAEREAELLGEQLADLDGMIARREEYMAAKQLEAGTLTISGDGVPARTIDFERSATHTIALLAAADRWTAGTAKIVENVRDWARLINKDSGMTADTLVLGETAAKAFLSNTALIASLDTRRVDLGLIAPEMTDMPGVTFLGRIMGTAVDVFSYDEWYIDPTTGNETNLITSTYAIMFSSQARATRYYGSVAVAEGDRLSLMEGRRIPDSWIEKNPAGRMVKLSCRPLPAIVQADATLAVQVVA